MLFFIPDISGFTRFVAATEISHSEHIVRELLEALIAANQTGVEVSEIEGDAVLFCKRGALPALPALVEQARRMFIFAATARNSVIGCAARRTTARGARAIKRPSATPRYAPARPTA